MKDNNENLSNELSNEAAESVAGGNLSDWSENQAEQLGMLLLEMDDCSESELFEYAKQIMNTSTPSGFLNDLYEIGLSECGSNPISKKDLDANMADLKKRFSL